MVDISENLKNERKKKGISLDQISKKTNISINALKALEAGDFHLIPGKFYLRNYLKNYLQVIEVDQKEFFTTHRDWLAANNLDNRDSGEAFIPELRYSRFKRRNIFLILFTLFFFIALLAAGSVYLYKKDMLPVWLNPIESAKLPPTGFIPGDAPAGFSIDRSPVNIRVDFLDTCRASYRRGTAERIGKTYEKGDLLEIRGYELSIYIANPSAVKFYLNGKEVSYLSKLTQPQWLQITPAAAARILAR